MQRILIPTDNVDFVPHLAEAYARCGCEVFTGATNFFLRLGKVDLLHYLWPEELSGWKVPDEHQLEKIENSVIWWSKRVKTIISVNNLYPHGYEHNESFKRLYEIFYTHCDAIVHHSNTSKELVLRHFPSSRQNRNVVTTMFNYDSLLPVAKATPQIIAEQRHMLGFAPSDFVVLSFGALRLWEELILIRKAFEGAKVPGKRLLMAGRYNQFGSVWKQRIRRMQWQGWLKKTRCHVTKGFIPDEEVHRYFNAADVVIIPRLHDLSSGIVGLGMTFGTLIIAPDHGSFPDYLANSENLLYKSGDAFSLAQTIEIAATMNKATVQVSNRQIADSWKWEYIAQACLEAVESQESQESHAESQIEGNCAQECV